MIGDGFYIKPECLQHCPALNCSAACGNPTLKRLLAHAKYMLSRLPTRTLLLIEHAPHISFSTSRYAAPAVPSLRPARPSVRASSACIRAHEFHGPVRLASS